MVITISTSFGKSSGISSEGEGDVIFSLFSHDDILMK